MQRVLESILAETTAAATQPFNYAVWIPKTYRVVQGIVIFAATLLFGALLLYGIRRLAARFRLKTSLVMATFALAFYLGLLGYRNFAVAENDPIFCWVNRITAAALLFVGLRFLDRLVVVPLLTRGGRMPMAKFVHQIVNIVLALFAVVIFASVAFDWNIDKFLAGSAVVSIVLGLALQETLGNFFSGLVMQASPPFAIGDWIVCGAHEGRVVDMTWRAVSLHTDDDNFVLLPNATVAKAEIVNYHAPSTATAQIAVGLDYNLPPLDAFAVLKAAALESPGVAQDPPPIIFVQDFGESAVIYEVKFWITQPNRHDEIEPAVRLSVWYRLKEKGYAIPFPIRTVEHVSLERKARREQAMAVETRARMFEKVPVLAPLSREQKEELAGIANDVSLAPGQVLFRQHDPGDSFYVISRGSVDVLVEIEGGVENKIATLKAGDFFGEMSALTGQPRTATIRAGLDFSRIQIEKADLLEIFQKDPGMMERISMVVAQRNAHREAAAQESANAAPAEGVRKEQRSLLARMKRFFHLGHAEAEA